MIVLGISGLDGAADFKQRHFPGLTPRQQRLYQGADSSAALLIDGRLMGAASEERFTRVKGTPAFPARAITEVLAGAGLCLNDVDRVAHNFNYGPYAAYFDESTVMREAYRDVYSPDAFLGAIDRHLPEADWSNRVTHVPHHVAHGASAFYSSGFEDATVLVADAIGEFHSTSLFDATSADGLTVRWQLPGLHSVGMLYGLVTLHLGFYMNFDEYKVMGLAPYGDPKTYRRAFSSVLELHPEGRYAVPVMYQNRTNVERETYAGSLAALAELLGPPRLPNEPLTQQQMDIAATLQEATTEALLHVLAHARRTQQSRRLCFAGGVGLNCTANAALRARAGFNEVFVQPVAGDDGTALGAAQYVAYHPTLGAAAPIKRREPMAPPLLGPAYDKTAVLEALSSTDALQTVRLDDWVTLADEVADRLTAGKVVAWYQGRMEFGPRALGNRSIVADPRDGVMRDRINAMVKMREEFRPLAPAVTAEYAEEIFDLPGPRSAYWYMIEIAQVRAQWRDRLGAVTHVDGSARLQVVERTHNEPFWLLLDAFRRRTGLPVLLNTSFNVAGQPIVCTPQEAVDTFISSGLDHLVVERYLVSRRP